MHVLGAEKCDSIAILLVSFLDISSIIMCWGLVCWSGSECWWVSVRLLELSRCKHGKESPWRTRRRHRPVYFAQQVFCVDFKLLLACVYSMIKHKHIHTHTNKHRHTPTRQSAHTYTEVNHNQCCCIFESPFQSVERRLKQGQQNLAIITDYNCFNFDKNVCSWFQNASSILLTGNETTVVVLFQGHI